MKSKIIINGAGGRMGKRLIALAVESGNFNIAAAIDRADHPAIGKDVGALAGIETLGINLSADYPAGADLAIDFSLPQGADKIVDYCVENSVALVSGKSNDVYQTASPVTASNTPMLPFTCLALATI